MLFLSLCACNKWSNQILCFVEQCRLCPDISRTDLWMLFCPGLFLGILTFTSWLRLRYCSKSWYVPRALVEAHKRRAYTSRQELCTPTWSSIEESDPSHAVSLRFHALTWEMSLQDLKSLFLIWPPYEKGRHTLSIATSEFCSRRISAERQSRGGRVYCVYAMAAQVLSPICGKNHSLNDAVSWKESNSSLRLRRFAAW